MATKLRDRCFYSLDAVILLAMKPDEPGEPWELLDRTACQGLDSLAGVRLLVEPDTGAIVRVRDYGKVPTGRFLSDVHFLGIPWLASGDLQAGTLAGLRSRELPSWAR